MSQEYSEPEDFKEHKQNIDTMYEVLGAIEIPKNSRVLDVGGGQGMHACFLAQYYELCYCLDIIDYQSLYDGEYYRLFKEKCERNSVYYSHRQLRFIEGDAMEILFRDNYFDLISSFNAMEHIPDPLQALEEMVRVTKVGGIIYLTFDPIWTADTGSHFIQRVAEPWEHLIQDQAGFIKKMEQNGALEGETNDFKYGMNQLRLERHREIFAQIIARDDIEVLHEASWSAFADPAYEEHPNYQACIKLGYSEEELQIRGMRYIFRKI